MKINVVPYAQKEHGLGKMDPIRRQRALSLLVHRRPKEFLLCRDVEAECHAISHTAEQYADEILRAAYNLRENSSAGRDVPFLPDETLLRGTAAGSWRDEKNAREARFQNMLQEKYEALNDKTFETIVRCRRCGSGEVNVDEKQPRSADEAATVFCVCVQCKNRWVMR